MQIVKKKFYKILILFLITAGCFSFIYNKKPLDLESILKLPYSQRTKLSKDEVILLTKNLNLREKIGFWAEFFVGTPYDTIPIGLYVEERKIKVYEALDCMSHVFTSYELAQSKNEREAVKAALDIRFIKKGELISPDSDYVKSYNGRFEYGEDMSFSGKYGKNITSKIGKTIFIKGSRKYKRMKILETKEMISNLDKLETGDIIFFVKSLKKRVADEIVGHLGIVSKKDGKVFIIHAKGKKIFDKSSTRKSVEVVTKVPLDEYLNSTYPFFMGVIVNRI
jgi:hypothetical protein